MDSVLYVGIDTSLGAHVVCAMAADGQVVARTTVPNDQAGAEQFVAWLHPTPRRTRGWPLASRPRPCTMCR
ncbi:IS110 family transposase [Sulfobacillus thermosulfidooxidans]|uniref:IS110 family transposase n=1 Tax=Sulfobacillus thermosulfidooxidans TaxID=28034 RepID=UPI0003642906